MLLVLLQIRSSPAGILLNPMKWIVPVEQMAKCPRRERKYGANCYNVNVHGKCNVQYGQRFHRYGENVQRSFVRNGTLFIS